MDEKFDDKDPEILSKQLERERVHHEHQLAQAIGRAEYQNEKKSDQIAFLALGLAIAVVIILGLTGVF